MVNVTNRDIWYVLGLSGIFVLGYLATSMIYMFFIRPIHQRRMVEQRLLKNRDKEKEIRNRIFKTEEESSQGLILTFLRKVGYHKLIRKLQYSLLQADINGGAGNFLSIAVILACGGLVFGKLWDNWVVGGILAVVLGTIPFLLIKMKKKRKGNLIEKQMPDIMELLARSLRAGHTLPAAMELAGKESPPPLGTELRLAYEEQRLGIGINDALRHMVDRVDSRDLRYFVTAVLIQSETGGNLAEVMEKIGYLIRDRLRVKGKIKGLTAEGRLSAFILGSLPFAMFLILYVIHRKYVMTLFTDPWGQKILIAGLISMTLGILSMRKIIQQIKP